MQHTHAAVYNISALGKHNSPSSSIASAAGMRFQEPSQQHLCSNSFGRTINTGGMLLPYLKWDCIECTCTALLQSLVVQQLQFTAHRFYMVAGSRQIQLALHNAKRIESLTLNPFPTPCSSNSAGWELKRHQWRCWLL